MKPIKFEESNKSLSRPRGTTAEQCSSLPILQVDDFCISLWQAGWRERLRFLFTGRIWLSVWSGVTQPPVKLTLEEPFERSKDVDMYDAADGHAGEIQL